MTSQSNCPACGAAWIGGKTCENDFYQMLFWETEYPEYGIVHHLMVLSYHLQHPHIYSMEGLAASKELLLDFLVRDLSTEDVRKKNRDFVDSSKRKFKITARPDSIGAYDHPVHWTMTAADVVARGVHNYVDSTREWARTILESLKASQNIAVTG